MATPFSITGALNVPGDVGLPNDPIGISFSSSFTSRADHVYNLSSSGTQAVDFGTVAMAKGLYVKVDAASAASVELSINGSDDTIEVAPGGFFLYGAASPTTGISSLDITYTDDAVVRVWVLG